MAENALQPIRDIVGTPFKAVGSALHTIGDSFRNIQPTNFVAAPYMNTFYPTWSYSPLFPCCPYEPFYPHHFGFGFGRYPIGIYDDTMPFVMPSVSPQQYVSAPTCSSASIPTYNIAPIQPMTVGKPYEIRIFDDEEWFPRQTTSLVPQQYQQGNPYAQPAFSGQSASAAPLPKYAKVQSIGRSLEELLNPQQVQQPQQMQGVSADNSRQVNQRQEVLDNTTNDTALEMQESLPSYYKDILGKKQNGTALSDAEEELFNNFQKLHTVNSPFLRDKDGNIKYDNITGGADTDKRYNNKSIENIRDILIAKDIAEIEKFIDTCSPEELEAVDYYWQMATATDKSGQIKAINEKPFREMLKDATLRWYSEWGRFNNSDFIRISKKLDDKTVASSPRSMAHALSQAIDDAHWYGHLNEDKVVELLNVIKSKGKTFAAAVLEEYSIERHDSLLNRLRQDKWFASQSTKDLCSEVF